MKSNRSKSVQCANVRPLVNAQSHNTYDDRTISRTLPAHCENEPRTLPAQSENTPSLKALARAVLGASLQCADVRAPGSAQPHITPDSRTLPRTLSAQSDEKPRTLPAHSEDAPHIASWCWWLAFSESEHLITYHHPSATRAEVLAKYPRALVAEPYEPAAAPQATEFLSTAGKEK